MEYPGGGEIVSDIHVRHILRYVEACDFLAGAKGLVLDAACGTGYGSKILAKNFEVLGIDDDPQAIEEAWKVKTSNCSFMQADLLHANFSVDNIVSIETIEHFDMNDGRKVLGNFHSWLPVGGILILSTPYCDHSGPSPITKQHLWEYSLTDLEITLNGCGFEIETMHLQRHEGQAGRLGYCMVRAIRQ